MLAEAEMSLFLDEGASRRLPSRISVITAVMLIFAGISIVAKASSIKNKGGKDCCQKCYANLNWVGILFIIGAVLTPVGAGMKAWIDSCNST